MPNTPQVNFNFYNNNVQNSTPLLGVSYVLARTTKGPFNDPSQLIRSYSQFQRIFGNEIVPDGSVSNIKKALELGSILRVSRVAGAGNTTYGEAKPGTNVKASTTSIKSAEWGGSGSKPGDDTAKMYYYFNTNNQVSLKFTCNFSQSTPEGKLGDEPITFEYLGNINGQNTWVTKYSNKTYKAPTTVVIQDFRYGGLTLTDNIESTVIAVGNSEPSTLSIKLTNPKTSNESITVNLNIKTKEMGSKVTDANGSSYSNFYIYTTNSTGPTNKIYFNQTIGFDGNGNAPAEDMLDSTMIFSYSNGNNPFIEANVFQSYIDNAPNIQFVLDSVESEGTNMGEVKATIKDMNNVIGLLRTYSNWVPTITLDDFDLSEKYANTYLLVGIGSNGGDASNDTWYQAYKATEAYNDGYQLICSHLCQYGEDINPINIYQKIANEVANKFELVLYVEVPKYNESGDIRTVSEVTNWLKTNEPIIGNSKSVAYYAGGIKYYDEYGSLQNCDVLGSVIGLGDTSASDYGPWYSFSGMNRGVITQAQGPVMENLGGPGKVEELQQLADWYCNLFVIKDTRASGKQTMLWHGFTSNPKNDSEKFLSIVRLNLYIKKSLRPILESYLEEPNTWSTWKSMYYEGKEVMDDLVNRQAMSEYTWIGDQDATSYDDLQVNNEADVRQGKYHLVIKYKDIVPLQEITVDVVIDAANNSVNITSSSSEF